VATRGERPMATVLNAYEAWAEGRMLPSGAYPTSERIFSTFNPALRPPRPTRQRVRKEETRLSAD
jgi:hypothetical protein